LLPHNAPLYHYTTIPMQYTKPNLPRSTAHDPSIARLLKVANIPAVTNVIYAQKSTL